MDIHYLRMIFESLVREALLCEAVTIDDASKAIDDHECIIVNYHSEGKDEHIGARLIEPHALGLTKAGYPVIRAFERTGDSLSGIVPGWKFMRLDRISSWNPTGQTFDRPASDVYKGLGEFNPDGDETMSVVYKVAKFGPNNTPSGQPSQNQPTSQGAEQSDVYRTNTEIGMSRLRNQLDNPIYLSDLQNAQSKQTPPQKEPVEKPQTIETEPIIPQNDELEQNDIEAIEEPEESSPEIYKTDTEQRMDRLRQQLEHPLTLDDFLRQQREKRNSVEKNEQNTQV